MHEEPLQLAHDDGKDDDYKDDYDVEDHDDKPDGEVGDDEPNSQHDNEQDFGSPAPDTEHFENGDTPVFKKRGRGRPPLHKNKLRTPVRDEDGSLKRKRGFQPGSSKNKSISRIKRISSSIPTDDDGIPLQIIDDEASLPEDPKGETKISKNGELRGGREFRTRTFKVLGRGNRFYMLSTEPARCMGFRDSYLLFQKHKKLVKIIIDNDEKFDLIDRNLIPHSYKGRTIGVVTARSVYREFGAKIVVGGKRVIDDYYEDLAREQGYVEGDLADPTDRLPPQGIPYNQNQYVAWHGASAIYHQAAITPISRETFKEPSRKQKINLTPQNWIFQHALSASQYNNEITIKRGRAWNARGIYEPYTGINFFPESTQPSKVIWEKFNPSEVSTEENNKVILETVIRAPNNVIRTGLKDVPAEIFEHLDPDIKKEILKQQALEREWDNL